MEAHVITMYFAIQANSPTGLVRIFYVVMCSASLRQSLAKGYCHGELPVHLTCLQGSVIRNKLITSLHCAHNTAKTNVSISSQFISS